ncbi:MAG: phage-related tail protein [Hyphomonadaceae bacterium]|nr:MAG: phage-related tail protein [Hyphomonadaceae bacterium]KAF0182679.1 MAG: phage-related tail protein [Hyphomonadaceae bacterium]
MSDQEIIEPKSMQEVIFDTPLVFGDQTIEKVLIRKPLSGELRGLSLIDVGRLELDALFKVLPRVTMPSIPRESLEKMDLSDLMAMGLKVAGFLTPRRMKTDFQNE